MKIIKISFMIKLQFLRCMTMWFLENINIYDKAKSILFYEFSRLRGIKKR